MDNTWTRILVFVILSLILGFILGRVTAPHSHSHFGEHPHMEKKIHVIKGGEADETMVWTDDEGKKVVIEKEMIDASGSFEFKEGEAKIHSIIKGIENSKFEGDSTFQIGKTKVELSRKNGEMQVEVTIDEEKEN